MKWSWKLKDIIMVGIIGVIFSLVYLGILYFSLFLQAALTPLGLAPFAFEIVYGIWFMAATFAIYIIRKPGVAIVAEMLAAILEFLMGNVYSHMVLISGFLQGLGAEAAFAAFRYKKWNWKTMLLAALGCTVLSFGWTLWSLSYYQLNIGLLIALFAVRLVSSVVFTAVLSKVLADRLAKTGVLKSYPIGKNFTVEMDE